MPDTAPTMTTDADSATASQQAIDAEMATIATAYQLAGQEETQPRLDYAPYRSSLLRHPTKDLHHADPEGIELWTPCFSDRDVDPLEADLTPQRLGHAVLAAACGLRQGCCSVFVLFSGRKQNPRCAKSVPRRAETVEIARRTVTLRPGELGTVRTQSEQ
jgi:hypothetical protein